MANISTGIIGDANIANLKEIELNAVRLEVQMFLVEGEDMRPSRLSEIKLFSRQRESSSSMSKASQERRFPISLILMPKSFILA